MGHISETFPASSLRADACKNLLASFYIRKANKESSFWSDITSWPDGPANHTGSNIPRHHIVLKRHYHDFMKNI